jgi:hypothetical protein
MANIFKNAVVSGVGVTAANVYTAPTGNTSICIELDVANTTSNTVSANVIIRKSNGSSAFIIKSAPIPTGSALQVISGQKIVLESGDYLQVQSDTAASIDAVASILQDV